MVIGELKVFPSNESVLVFHPISFTAKNTKHKRRVWLLPGVSKLKVHEPDLKTGDCYRFHGNEVIS